MLLTTAGAVLIGLLCVSLTGVASAGTLANARVMLHIGPSPAVPSAKACLPAQTGVQTDCLDWVTNDTNFPAGSTKRYSLVVTQAVDGVGGLSCGIEYSGNLFCGFDLCTDGLEFSNNSWPNSGGGNRITWTTCGATVALPDRYAVTASGLQVVFGSFYVYSYGGDGFFQVTKNPLSPGPDDDELAVGSCAAQTDFLSSLAGGRIDIGAAGPGYNPCGVVPTEPATWGDLKNRFKSE